MNSVKAKEMLAAYLVGRRVSADSLESAIDLINEDELVARLLSEELRCSGKDEYEFFRRNLAEFSEQSPAERVRS